MDALFRKMLLVLLSSFVIIFLGVLLFRNLQFSYAWTFGDLMAFPTNLKVTTNWAFFIWNSEGMGFLAFKPFNYYVTVLFSSTLLGSSLAQKVLFLSALPISSLSFYFLLRKLHVTPVPSILGALAYSINPLTISEIVGGSVTLIVYAMFPIVFYYLLKVIGFDKSTLRDLAILGLLGFAIFNLHAAFWYILIVAPLILWSLVCRYTKPKQILRLSLPLVIFTLVLFPNILGYAGVFGITSQKADFVSDASFCYSDASFYNVIRLAGNRGSAQAGEYLGYDLLTPSTSLGYVMVIVASFFWLTYIPHNKRDGKRIVADSLSFSLILLIGFVLLLKSFPSLVDLHSILASLRNPGKLMYPISFSFCFLFAMGTERLIKKVEKSRFLRRSIIIGLILASAILLYNIQAFDGTVGLAKVRASNYYVEDKYQYLPSILQNLDRTYVNYRVLFLPWEYSTLLRIASQIPRYFGLPPGSGVTSDIQWLGNTFNVVLAKNGQNRSDLLSLFSVKYVVIDKTYASSDQDQEWHKAILANRDYAVYRLQDSYWATGYPNYFYSIFKQDSDFELIFENSDFAIFKNNRALTMVHLRQDNPGITISYTPVSNNLLTNPTFDKELSGWHVWPEDHVNVTDEANVGRALTLYGQEEWFTNCYQLVPAEENVFYILKFSIKAYNNTDAHAKVLWFNKTTDLEENDAFSADYIKVYERGLADGRWYDFTESFSAPKGTKYAAVWLGASRIEGFAGTITEFSNISFCEAEPSIEGIKLISPSIENINYYQTNPTSYSMDIKSTSPFMLVLSESYDPSWVCIVNDRRISSLLTYEAVNGFRINMTGDLSITVEYEIQRVFYVSCFVSIATLLAGSLYLVLSSHPLARAHGFLRFGKIKNEKNEATRQGDCSTQTRCGWCRAADGCPA
jgi:hypothetical protein